MHEMIQWFFMGGYACYVWTAYGLVSLLLILNGVSCVMQGKRIRKSLQTWFKQTSQ